MSNSTAELVPLFPSATHPAIPIASQLLSTLRNLTAPGKGNDLRPEERAALVGIAALLGCEKIQSKDLPLSSAQKASSVSPAHFRSALARCRTLLSSSADDSRLSSSKRSTRGGNGGSPKRDEASVSANASASTSGDASASATSSAAQSPFQTPRKKFKYSSGIDISGLVRTPRSVHGHEPSMASPLRQSVTPSTSRVRRGVQGNQEEEGVDADADEEADAGEGEGGEGGEGMGTPTKRIKYSHPGGVDLEHPPPSARAPTRKRTENASAFFALRPGSSLTAAGTTGAGAGASDASKPERGEDAWLFRRPEDVERRRARVRGARKAGEGRKKIKKVDWTYRESVWGSANSDTWGKVCTALPSWLEAHGGDRIDRTQTKGIDIVETILAAFERRTVVSSGSGSGGEGGPGQGETMGVDG